MSSDDIDPTLPEVVRSFLASGATLESIRLDARGVWWHRGARFENRRIIALFSRSVNRTQGGTWVLEIGRFTYPIEVDDTPFFVESLVFCGVDADEEIELHLVGGDVELLDPETLRHDGELGITCAVRGGRFRARLRHGPYHALTQRLEQDEGGYALRLAGRLVRL